MLSQISTKDEDYIHYTSQSYTNLKRYNLGIGRACFEEHNQKSYDAVWEALAPAIQLDPADVPYIPAMLAKRGKYGWEDGKWVGLDMVLVCLIEMYLSKSKYLQEMQGCAINNIDDLVAWNFQNPVGYVLFQKLWLDSNGVEPGISRTAKCGVSEDLGVCSGKQRQKG